VGSLADLPAGLDAPESHRPLTDNDASGITKLS
jgi:hypothetical protein